ncbi:MAG: hypothetical protein ACM3X7_06995 [Solirubrobacterales bacterium]
MREDQEVKQCGEELGKLFKWIKKVKRDNEQGYLQRKGHCNNYSSHCCLSCDRCFGGRKSFASPLKDKNNCDGT